METQPLNQKKQLRLAMYSQSNINTKVNLLSKIRLIIFYIMDNRYQYLEGAGQQGVFENCINCCGNIVGFIKGYVPCVGCFLCCCDHPFVTVQEGQQAILSKFGKYHKTLGPGLAYINPLTQSIQTIDCRLNVLQLSKQAILTKDNIALKIDACVYYSIDKPKYAMYRIQQVAPSVQLITKAILKNTASVFTFQDLLEKRNDIANDIEIQIQPYTRQWGIKIKDIYFKDFEIAKSLQNELNSAPVAKREGQAMIVSAQADVNIARMLSERSKLLDSNTAMQMRYLQTLRLLGNKENTTIVYTVTK